MSIDERLRLSIHGTFTEILGQEEADALIAHIMPVPWTDVATKDDLRVLSAELRSEMAELRAEIHGEIGALRGELHGEIGTLRSEVGGLRAELHESIVGQTRWLMGYVTALSIAMLAAARLVF